MHERSREQSPNFDTWLTNLPDEEIIRLSRAAEQPFVNHSDDPEGLAEAMDIAMRFRGEQYQNEQDSTRGLISFGLQLALERMRREGDLTKEGVYSLEPDAPDTHFTLTEQWWQRHGSPQPDSPEQ